MSCAHSALSGCPLGSRTPITPPLNITHIWRAKRSIYTYYLKGGGHRGNRRFPYKIDSYPLSLLVNLKTSTYLSSTMNQNTNSDNIQDNIKHIKNIINTLSNDSAIQINTLKYLFNQLDNDISAIQLKQDIQANQINTLQQCILQLISYSFADNPDKSKISNIFQAVINDSNTPTDQQLIDHDVYSDSDSDSIS